MDGKLSQHFVGVGAKRISATEAAKAGVSNGHELSASGRVLDMLGRRRAEFPCTYLYFSDDFGDSDYIEDRSTVTLYDAREKDASRSPEWRLYYPAGCLPMESMEPGDYCWVAQRASGDVLVVVAAAGSASSRRLDRLFGTDMRLGADVVPTRAGQFRLFDFAHAGDEDIDLADADVLLALGVAPAVETVDRLPDMIATFGGAYPFPTTAAFTAYARTVCSIQDPMEDPDSTLFQWVTVTNDLYFAYERHVLQPVLDADLANREHVDLDRFFSLATRFKNARFSRAGSSFEHHIAALLTAAGVDFSQPRRLPDGSKPDFILPSLAAYGDADLPSELLTFLAAKTTTKERWRQVATEATLIEVKHLITMDRELNSDVLDSMGENLVVPVVPWHISRSYPSNLQGRLMAVDEFLNLVRARQSELATYRDR